MWSGGAEDVMGVDRRWLRWIEAGTAWIDVKQRISTRIDGDRWEAGKEEQAPAARLTPVAAAPDPWPAAARISGKVECWLIPC
jgi:hypothetical protein